MTGRKPRPSGAGRLEGLSERELWRLVTREAKPLKQRALASFPELTPEPAPSESGTPAGGAPGDGAAAGSQSAARKAAGSKENSPRAPLPRGGPPTPPPAAVRPPAPVELDHGAVIGLDRRKAERLRRGRLPIDATLDLHGMNRTAAHQALGGFLAISQARGHRCVLVITGKGLGKGASKDPWSDARWGGDFGETSGGVLRRQVPLWLNQPPNRARVLAFDFAQPRHGGLGALYVLLRRTRP